MDRLTVIPLLVPEDAIQDSRPFRFRLGKTKMAANCSLQLVFIDVTALHRQLIFNHDGWSHRKPQFGVFFGAILLEGLRCGLDLQFVLLPQPGDDFSKMPSGLPAGLV